MSNSIKALFAIGLLSLVAACGGASEEETVYVEVEPIVEEPTMSKY
ncbi:MULTISPECIES: hypothetical protein [Falsihalocynthiibacter]|nr:hypothetical protein [Falsihalocynthiibacter arcticus]